MKAHLTRPVTSKQIIYAACEQEFNKLLDRRSLDLDTVVLFLLHSKFGFGKDRCRRFYEAYAKEYKEILSQYEEVTFERLRSDLLRYGIEVEKWNKELIG